MKHWKKIVGGLLLVLYEMISVVRAEEVKTLQLNIWHEGTCVEGGFEAIVDEIVRADADIVFLSEVRNYKQVPFVPRLTEALAAKGAKYYGRHSKLDVGILSRYPILSQEDICPELDAGGSGSLLKAVLQDGERQIAAYSAHLDYKNYACYLPRGYDGSTWKKMEAPVLSPDSILKANRLAYREEVIGVFLREAKKDVDAGRLILLGGDFNEPSHLDWQEDTKDLWDHNGAIVNWDCSRLLLANGFKDLYREVHPNPITHPGFTFPSDNDRIAVDKLAWAPDSDERDRIDFIYYKGSGREKAVSAVILGPSRSIIRGKRMEEDTNDVFLKPLDTWPSDHKGVLGVLFNGE